MAEKVEVIVTATDQASGVLSKIGGLGKGLLGAGFGIITAGAAAAGAAIVGAGAGLTYAVGEAMSAEESMAQLNAVIKSTGGIAGWTADMATNLADQLSAVTRYEDDAIIAGESMLLTFKNIGKDTFPDATQAMLDMSTAMNQDLKSSAIQIGKALNDPIAGVSALSRVGVTFTEQQKEMIKSLVESGDVMSAQKIILQELQSEFGGSAEAAGQTFGGQLDILRNKLGNVAEDIGTALLPAVTEIVKSLGPLIVDMAQKLADLVASEEFQAWLKSVVNWFVTKLIPGIVEFTKWIGTNLPPAIQALVGFWNTQLKPALEATWNFIKTYIIPIFREIGVFFTQTIPQAVAFLKTKWDENFLGIKTRVETTFANIRDIFNVFRAIFEGDWRKVGELLRDIWDRTWEAMKTMFREGVDALINFAKSIGTRVREIDWLQLGKDIIVGIGNGMIAMTEWIQETIKGVLQSAIDVAKGFLGIQSPSRVMADQIGKQMAAGIGVGLQRGITGMSTNVTAGLSMLTPAAASAVAPIGGGRSVTVVIQAGTLLSFADETNLEMKLKDLIMRWVR